MRRMADSSFTNCRSGFDNPEARLAHGFSIDMQQVEVREMVKMTDNTGHPYPPTK
jgi:hypothetical protein